MDKLILGLMMAGVASIPFLKTQPIQLPVSSEKQTTGTSAQVQKTNPNERNLDKFLSLVQQVGAKQGKSSADLSVLTKEMREYALATTTDFFAQFVKESQKNSRKISYLSPFTEKVTSAFEKIAGLFTPRADAAGLSFGGMVIYVFPCTCTGNWLIGMMPMSIPPIILITHYPGAQMFTNYNAPFTMFMLGHYRPGGVCKFYVGIACAPLPSQAQTTPFLGSS